MTSRDGQVRQLLQSLTPDPPNTVTVQRLRAAVPDRTVPETVVDRRRRWLPAVVALAAAVVAVTVVAVAQGARDNRAGVSPAATLSAPSHPSGTASSSPQAPACTPSDVSARLGAAGGEASSEYRVVVLTNISAATCAVSGYPAVAVQGNTDPLTPNRGSGGVGHPVASYGKDGGLYAVPDLGPGTVELPPHGTAWFAVGTYDADVPLITITELDVTLHPGEKAVPVPLGGYWMRGSGPPVRVDVTAFAAGTGSAG